MSEDSGGHEAPTRREYIKYSGAVVGGVFLAGCAGQSDSGSTPESTSTETETDTATEMETTIGDTSYTVSMERWGGCLRSGAGVVGDVLQHLWRYGHCARAARWNGGVRIHGELANAVL